MTCGQEKDLGSSRAQTPAVLFNVRGRGRPASQEVSEGSLRAAGWSGLCVHTLFPTADLRKPLPVSLHREPAHSTHWQWLHRPPASRARLAPGAGLLLQGRSRGGWFEDRPGHRQEEPDVFFGPESEEEPNTRARPQATSSAALRPY